MLLIKIGGSLIAPKNLNIIDYDYLFKISSWLKQFNNIFLIHGTGNVGHNWALNLKPKSDNLISLIKKNYNNGKEILDKFFSEIDVFFPQFKRLQVVDFIGKQTFFHKTIIGGDILPNGKIFSSDEIFSIFLKNYEVNKAIMLTDVDGVLDANGKVIKFINREKFNKIKFWKKNNDVTGGMKAKIKNILKAKKTVIICNGTNFQNLEKILSGKKDFVGTIVCYLK